MAPLRSTTEARLLCGLLGRRGAASDDAGLEALARDVDWQGCLELASPALFPLLERRLSERVSRQRVPDWVVRRLAETHRAQALVYLRQRHELDRILAAFAAATLPAVVLKGAALAHLAYPDPSLRPMVDLDLLVPAQRREEAGAALTSLGYRIPPRWQVRPATGPAAKAEADKPFELPGTPVLVELHTQLEWVRPPFVYPLEHVWTRSVPASLGGRPARVLHPDDFLLHLCLHLSSYHGFEHGLRGLVDVLLHLESRTQPWDWPAQAAAWGAQGTAGWMVLTLALARDLLGAPVPEAVLRGTPAGAPSDAAFELAAEQLFSAPRRRVPPGLVTVLRASGPLERARRTLVRLNPWRREEARRHPWLGARLALRRATLDLRTRAPRYLAALRGGLLGRSHVEAALAWERRREELERLMADGERRLQASE